VVSELLELFYAVEPQVLLKSSEDVADLFELI
jgi:hypothetical protein